MWSIRQYHQHVLTSTDGIVQALKGDYKWMLYGDADTLFFVDGVLELLQDFDPSIPYFITGQSPTLNWAIHTTDCAGMM